MENAAPNSDTWDPLQSGAIDLEFVLAAQKREIRNILKSYTGYYDLFGELLQNAQMKASAISPRVNSPKNDDAGIMNPVIVSV